MMYLELVGAQTDNPHECAVLFQCVLPTTVDGISCVSLFGGLRHSNQDVHWSPKLSGLVVKYGYDLCFFVLYLAAVHAAEQQRCLPPDLCISSGV